MKGVKLTTEQFIERANIVHNNFYCYSKVQYINANSKVEIICPEHKNFWQRAGNHLFGIGCSLCNARQRLTTFEFIEKARKIHGNRYDYSNVIYFNTSTKVKIQCLKHWIFYQSPNEHLNGKGCSKCSKKISKLETKWLNEQLILEKHRQYKITIDKKWFQVDGYDPLTNTIYEFLGDYWHGNPDKYKPNGLNEIANKTFGELYQETVNRIKLFENNGYNVEYIWETDYKKG